MISAESHGDLTFGAAGNGEEEDGSEDDAAGAPTNGCSWNGCGAGREMRGALRGM